MVRFYVAAERLRGFGGRLIGSKRKGRSYVSNGGSISGAQAAKLRKAALSNGGDYHLVSWICRGNSIIYGTNGEKSSPKFKRTFYDKNSEAAYCCHAEMQVIDKAQATKNDVLYVTRFRKNGQQTMSFPCSACMKHIERVGIRCLFFTTWDGTWVKYKVKY